jgi:hypothetical protein
MRPKISIPICYARSTSKLVKGSFDAVLEDCRLNDHAIIITYLMDRDL